MSTNSNNDVLEHRVTSLEKETSAALRGIDESLRTLTALEAHHAQTKADTGRALDWLKDHDTRLRTIEQELPQVRLVVKHVIGGVVAIVGMVGVAAAKVTFGW